MLLTVNSSDLSGHILVPGSKSHTIRAVAVASLAYGTSHVHKPLVSSDTLSAVECYRSLGARINTKKDDLQAVLKLLPSEKSPTISSLADSDYIAVEVIIEDKIERTLVPALKRAGASGIITYPLNKVIH